MLVDVSFIIIEKSLKVSEYFLILVDTSFYDRREVLAAR